MRNGHTLPVLRDRAACEQPLAKNYMHVDPIRPQWSGPPCSKALGAEEDGSDGEEAQA